MLLNTDSFDFQVTPVGFEGVKSASSDVDICRDIMKTIYAENPSHWPYGLTPEHADGGAYLIRKASSMEPVGFVGWQERFENGEKVGSYAIGILPEHRSQGYAKQAVTEIIRQKRAHVDRVVANIMPDNDRSKRLASRLGIEIRETF